MLSESAVANQIPLLHHISNHVNWCVLFSSFYRTIHIEGINYVLANHVIRADPPDFWACYKCHATFLKVHANRLSVFLQLLFFPKVEMHTLMELTYSIEVHVYWVNWNIPWTYESKKTSFIFDMILSYCHDIETYVKWFS